VTEALQASLLQQACLTSSCREPHIIRWMCETAIDCTDPIIPGMPVSASDRPSWDKLFLHGVSLRCFACITACAEELWATLGAALTSPCFAMSTWVRWPYCRASRDALLVIEPSQKSNATAGFFCNRVGLSERLEDPPLAKPACSTCSN